MTGAGTTDEEHLTASEVGCPAWCLGMHPVTESPEDRAHCGERDVIDLTAHPEDGMPGWLSVYAWQQPGHAAGVSVLDVGSDHYLPAMSPAEARELAAALVARADDAEAAG
jgi:hypothetical protein